MKSKFTQLEILFFLFWEVSVHDRWTECPCLIATERVRFQRQRDQHHIWSDDTEHHNTTCLSFFVFCSPPVLSALRLLQDSLTCSSVARSHNALLNNITQLSGILDTDFQQSEFSKYSSCPIHYYWPVIRSWIYCTSNFTCISVHSHKANLSSMIIYITAKCKLYYHIVFCRSAVLMNQKDGWMCLFRLIFH